MNYQCAYACLECCKSFKRGPRFLDRDMPLTLTCPECGRDALCFGRHFKPPKKSDVKQWLKVRFLAENGFWFQKIRVRSESNDSIPYPQTIEEAKKFVVKYRQFAIDELAQIAKSLFSNHQENN